MKFKDKVSLDLILQITGAKPLGNLEVSITGINEIHTVENGDISFVDSPKYYDRMLKSKASVILINSDKVNIPEGKLLLVTDDPFDAYMRIVERFKPFVPCSSSISPTAKIGEGTVIQPNAFVGNNVVIGKNCLIHSNVSIYDNCIIGDNVIIHAGCVLGADAYYFQKHNGTYRKFLSSGNVVIGNNVEIGALCTIDKGVSNDTTVGDGTKFDNHVQVGHDTRIGKNCLIGCHCSIAGVTVIEDDVLIWADASINKDLVIGKGTVVLATSAVDKSLEPGSVVFGIPADNAWKRWRELAALRRLPALMRKLDV
jgi:UDP-3-O-[3-hydroxymyristoyl] glucosamine N-acyltransferase